MIFKTINAFYRHFLLKRYVRKRIRAEKSFEEKSVLENFDVTSMEPLTESEKSQVDAVFGEHIGSYSELALFKKYRGFDPQYVSHYMYLPVLAHKLNDYHYSKMFEHKSLQGYIAKGLMKHPHCYVRCISQEYYSNDMNQLSREQAISECLKNDILIVKDSTDSSGGRSVERIMLNGKNEIEKKKEIEHVFDKRKHDFVIQECLKQHSSMAKFNSTSINTLRVTTLYLNGKFSVLSIILRFGKEGMKVDNWGAGGIICGVANDGQLNDFGYDIHLNMFTEYNGVTLAKERLSQVPTLIKTLELEHTIHFSLCKFIGWDICFNEANEPVVIELNSSQPGVIGEQLCTGPIFGDRTQEVLKYCHNKKFNYNESLFQY